jgi:hypothetical protein
MKSGDKEKENERNIKRGGRRRKGRGNQGQLQLNSKSRTDHIAALSLSCLRLSENSRIFVEKKKKKYPSFTSYLVFGSPFYDTRVCVCD